MDDLHDHLLRLHGCKDVLSDSLLLHVVAELLCDLIADVGVKQRAADVLHRLRNVDFGNLAFSLDDLERSLKSFT